MSVADRKSPTRTLAGVVALKVASRLVFGLLWLLLPCVALASPSPPAPTQADQAAAHYHAGQQAYGAERWADALREFQLGYALAPRPEFLINFAQVHRKLGRLGDAAIDCERYLAAAPTSAMAGEVSRLLTAIREEQAAQLRGPPEPASPPLRVEPVPAAPSLDTRAAVPAPARPHRRRAALIGGLVAGGVVVLGLSIGLGVGLTRGNSYPDAALRGDFR